MYRQVEIIRAENKQFYCEDCNAPNYYNRKFKDIAQVRAWCWDSIAKLVVKYDWFARIPCERNCWRNYY